MFVLLFALAVSADGEVTERIVCADATDESYALFVPKSYDAAKKWPIVYALDARGHALVPLERFRAAAEELGYIVASSYNSASDGPNTPNIAAMRAMWRDTHAKLSIDDRRVYVAGFSGTVRAGVDLAIAAPGSIAGIIGSGAGFPTDHAPDASMKFAFFGAVGTRDFNFIELQELDHSLTALHLPHRIEEFEGTHEWMPPPLAREALAWMALREMRSGFRARDVALIDTLWRDDVTRAAALPVIQRARLVRSLADDYRGLHDVSPVPAPDPGELASAQKKRDRELRDEAAALEEARRVVATARTSEEAVRALHIDALKRRSDDSAKRILSTLLAQTGFYLPREHPDRADYFRGIAEAIRK
jgi:predicted esterase